MGLCRTFCRLGYNYSGAVVAVISQLPMQSVPITTDVVSFESRSGRGVQHYVIKVVSDLRQVRGFLRLLHQ